ncbi:uncharacterized protein LOC131948937 [Physella acuta]|uniref:uncharacterized protein LOC131948937 n=1 Tax=Physella acuta TaxID=109671 RepID=UPI0027DC7D25|nr:uncharacterized protein LOC131948937 [Physella acuta]
MLGHKIKMNQQHKGTIMKDARFKGNAYQNNQFQNCTHKHESFIPINEFTIYDLPQQYQVREIYLNIIRLSNLTTRIKVRVDQNDTSRLGTGTVSAVKFHYATDNFGRNYKKCAIIEVTTAFHVVRNNKDASKTTVELFYNDYQTRHAVKFLKGKSVKFSNREEDWCIFVCYTKNIKLADELNHHLKTFQKLSRKINRMFPGKSDLAVIVSHPHGGPKKVSIGTWTVTEPERFVVVGNGLTITAVVFGDMIIYTVHLMRPDIVTGKFSEEVGIECEVVYPDGTTTFYPMWQMDQLVKHTKHELFMKGGLRDFREDDLYLEIELPGEERQPMDDNQQLAYYRNDLSFANRIHMKEKPQHFDCVVRKSVRKHSPPASNFGGGQNLHLISY